MKSALLLVTISLISGELENARKHTLTVACVDLLLGVK